MWNVHTWNKIVNHTISFHVLLLLLLLLEAASILVNKNLALNSNRALITGCPINNIRKNQEKHNYATLHTLSQTRKQRRDLIICSH